MSYVNSYIYNKNGLCVRYSMEYQTWQEQGYSVGNTSYYIPRDFMPFPGFEKRSFVQTIKYRIRNKDWFGINERRRRAEIQYAHEGKRTLSWFQKQQEDKRKQKMQEVQACTPEHMRATGVDKLINQINNAKYVDIAGRSGVIYNRFFDDVSFSWIDDILIDLENRVVNRGDTVILDIPETQIRPICEALNKWRMFAIKNGTKINR